MTGSLMGDQFQQGVCQQSDNDIRWPVFVLCKNSYISLPLLKRHQIFIENQC